MGASSDIDMYSTCQKNVVPIGRFVLFDVENYELKMTSASYIARTRKVGRGWQAIGSANGDT